MMSARTKSVEHDSDSIGPALKPPPGPERSNIDEVVQRGSVLDAISNRDVTTIARYLREHESRDPVLRALGNVFDPNPTLREPMRAHLKKRRRGRPARSGLGSDEIARRVVLADKDYEKVEAGIASLEAQGIARSTAFRERRLLGLKKRKSLNL